MKRSGNTLLITVGGSGSDLASMDQVIPWVIADHPALHVLISNAGVMSAVIEIQGGP
jgi:NAD(P)-dependent dehydrogenase (short-subunit alcohol dehydrogenase family)